jgi:hypothetical protein
VEILTRSAKLQLSLSKTPESDGPVGKEAMLRCSAQKYLKVFVSLVYLDPADEFHHCFLIAFEKLPSL